MRLRCPCCGGEISLDMLIAHDAARASVELALKTTPIGKSMLMYLGLFRPLKRALSWDRVATLLAELQPLVEAKSFDWERVTYPVTPEAWMAGMDEIQRMRQSGKLNLPLESHGLLKAIVARQYSQAQQQAAAREEQAKIAAAAAAKPIHPSHRPAVLSERSSSGFGNAVEKARHGLSEKLKALKQMQSYKPNPDRAAEIARIEAFLATPPQEPPNE